jgi:DNA-directed RNA polymerase subunit L
LLYNSINTMSKYDIKISQVDRRTFKGLESSRLILNISGSDISIPLINAIRRTIIREIPTYVYDNSMITIDANTSKFDNDYMRGRLSMIPIFNIKNNITILQKDYWHKVDYTDNKRPKHPDDNEEIDMYISSENKTQEIMSVTTNDVKVFHNGKKVNMYTHIEPILLLKLNPGELFKCKTRAVLGVGLRSEIYNAAWSFYEYENDKKFLLTIESHGQMGEYDVLIKGIQICHQKLEILADKIKNNKIIKDNVSNQGGDKSIKLIFDDEDHTLGNLINDELQNSKDIVASGYNKSDYLIRQVEIKFTSIGNDPIKRLLVVVGQIQTKLSYMQNLAIMAKKNK